MVDSYIQLPTPADVLGSKTQTYLNVIGGMSVHSEAVTATTSAGVEITIFPVSGTVSVNQGTLNNLGSLYYITGLGMGTVRVEAGTVGVSGGTLQSLGTVYGLSHGTVDMINAGTISTLQSGTLNTLNSGTINYVSNLGTIYAGSICVTSGTVAVTGALASNPTDGTLTQLGTLYGLAHGTINMINAGTISTLQSGTLNTINSGTINYINNIGTLYGGSLCVTSGTLDVQGSILGTFGIDMGTITEVYKIGTVYAGSICITSGTVNLAGSGTVNVANGTVGVNMGTITNVYTLGTMYAGSVCVTSGTVGISAGTMIPAGLGTVKISDGTLGLNMGTLTSVGSATVFSKHDLHVYDSVGTVCTGEGTIAQTASKIIKVHHYKAQADGTYGFHFADTKPNGGTVDQGWYFLQREGVVTPFVSYPGYLFKTSTAGSGLCIGTWPSVPCNGTLRLTMIYTDDDTS